MTIAKILPESAYWELRRPFDSYLPVTVEVSLVKSELGLMQTHFRDGLAADWDEGEDWELPGHYQHVRVFYTYLYTTALYSPLLTQLIRETISLPKENWIGEFECYGLPGANDRECVDMVYYEKSFLFCEGDNCHGLVKALGLSLS